jgi:hypothetical protein
MNKKYLLNVLPVLIVLKVKLIGFQEEEKKVYDTDLLKREVERRGNNATLEYGVKD